MWVTLHKRCLWGFCFRRTWARVLGKSPGEHVAEEPSRETQVWKCKTLFVVVGWRPPSTHASPLPALKSLEAFSGKVVFQMDLEFPTKQLIPSFCGDWFLFNRLFTCETCFAGTHVPPQDGGSSFRRRDSTCLLNSHFSRSLLRLSRFSLFPCWVSSVLIAPLFYSGGLTDASMSALQHVSLFSHCGATANTLGTFEQEPPLKGQLQELLVGLNKYLLQGRYSHRPPQKTPGGGKSFTWGWLGAGCVAIRNHQNRQLFYCHLC